MQSRRRRVCSQNSDNRAALTSSFGINSKLIADLSVDTLRGVPLLGAQDPVFLAYCKLCSKVAPLFGFREDGLFRSVTQAPSSFLVCLYKGVDPCFTFRSAHLHASITGDRGDRVPRTVGQMNKDCISSCHARACVPQNRAGSTKVSDGLALPEARQPDICDRPSLA
jgi:hypothetical protein